MSFPPVTGSRPLPARALRPAEREAVLRRLHEERFQDRSPAAVYAALLDEGEYHCSYEALTNHRPFPAKSGSTSRFHHMKKLTKFREYLSQGR
jgi:hypothetical protein